jgi:hypothetical protein
MLEYVDEMEAIIHEPINVISASRQPSAEIFVRRAGIGPCPVSDRREVITAKRPLVDRTGTRMVQSELVPISIDKYLK